jgi:hypothetical protein
MAANPRLTSKTVAPFFNPPNLSHGADVGHQHEVMHRVADFARRDGHELLKVDAEVSNPVGRL